MGAWGHGTFDNDDACDWLYELEQEEGAGVLMEALQDAADPGGDDLEADTACYALAAAEIVAALAGHPRPDLPEGATDWIAANPAKPSPQLVELAHRAVRRVLEGSELAELWGETEESAQWRADVEDLLARLGRAPAKA